MPLHQVARQAVYWHPTDRINHPRVKRRCCRFLIGTWRPLIQRFAKAPIFIQKIILGDQDAPPADFHRAVFISKR